MKLKILFFNCLLFWAFSIHAQNNGKSGAGEWQYGHCLKEVHFGGTIGNNYIPIAKDDSSGDYMAPQFVKSHPNGCDNSTGGVIDKQDPVAYVSGTKAEVKACFNTDCTHSYYIRGLGPTISTGQIIFPQQMVTPSNGQVIYDWKDADRTFVSNKVKHFDKFKITWQVSEDGNTWVDIDDSENTLYVTHKEPATEVPGADSDGTQYRHGIGYEWFESLLHISCKNANDKTSKTSIFNAIWSDFGDNEIKNVRNEALYYYYRWDLPYHSTNTGYLFQNRDGQCYSWCSLLIDLLKIQGIDQSNDIVLVDSPDNQWFLIKDWQELDNPFETFNTLTNCDINNSHTLITEPDLSNIVQNVGTNYFYQFYYNEAQDDSGVIGQSAPNPESWFQQHCLVYLDFMGRYYDPSYGKSYSSINAFRNASVDLWVCFGVRNLEQVYETLDPNHNYLPHYDFTGDGDLDDWVDEYRAYNTVSQLNLTTQIFDR